MRNQPAQPPQSEEELLAQMFGVGLGGHGQAQAQPAYHQAPPQQQQRPPQNQGQGKKQKAVPVRQYRPGTWDAIISRIQALLANLFAVILIVWVWKIGADASLIGLQNAGFAWASSIWAYALPLGLTVFVMYVIRKPDRTWVYIFFAVALSFLSMLITGFTLWNQRTVAGLEAINWPMFQFPQTFWTGLVMVVLALLIEFLPEPALDHVVRDIVLHVRRLIYDIQHMRYNNQGR